MKWIAMLLMCLAPVTLTVEVEPQEPVTSRLLFVVDRSGSMHGDHFTRALTVFRETVETPTDDLQIGVLAFNDANLRWSGRPERDVPKGWARLPAQGVAEEAQAWLTALGANGDTLVTQALVAALADDRKGMTIVLVSDGLFGRERTNAVLEAVEKAQEKRQHRAVIACYGLGASQKILCELGRSGRGGYVREEVEVGVAPTLEELLRPPGPPVLW